MTGSKRSPDIQRFHASVAMGMTAGSLRSKRRILIYYCSLDRISDHTPEDGHAGYWKYKGTRQRYDFFWPAVVDCNER